MSTTDTDAEFVERFFTEAQERGWLVGEDRHRLRDIARRVAKLEAARTGKAGGRRMTSDDKIEIKELLAATLWVSAQLAHPQKKLDSYVACQPEERKVMRDYARWLLRVARDGENDATKAFAELLR